MRPQRQMLTTAPVQTMMRRMGAMQATEMPVSQRARAVGVVEAAGGAGAVHFCLLAWMLLVGMSLPT